MLTDRLTDYHAKYLAAELARRYPSDRVEKLAVAVAGAQVDLNPHQVGRTVAQSAIDLRRRRRAAGSDPRFPDAEV